MNVLVRNRKSSTNPDVEVVVSQLGVLDEDRVDFDELVSIETLVDAIESSNLEIRGHAKRVRDLVGIALTLGDYPESTTVAAGAASTLHDLGKLAIEPGILDTPGPLTTAEMDRVRQHAQIGADVILELTGNSEVSTIVRHHHEWWDGSGYPDGLAGRDIPLNSRLIATADAFDAMLSHRPYRQKLSLEDASAELRRCSGGQFDPSAVDLILRAAERSKYESKS